MLTVTQEGQTASEEGRSRSHVSIYKPGYFIPNPTPHSLRLFPLVLPSMHQSKYKMLIQHLLAASAYFIPSSRQIFLGQSSSTKLPKRQQCFFQGLGFHNLQLGRESSTWENPELGVHGAGSIPPADPSCRDTLSKVRHLGGWIWIAEPRDWEKADKRHVHLCLKTSLYKCLYIRICIYMCYLLNRLSFRLWGKITTK